MAIKILLTIGADNDTHEISGNYENRVIKILLRYWSDFTLSRHTGCYKGTLEDSLTAVIMVLQLVFAKLHMCVDDLKTELEQKTIAIEIQRDVNYELR